MSLGKSVTKFSLITGLTISTVVGGVYISEEVLPPAQAIVIKPSAETLDYVDVPALGDEIKPVVFSTLFGHFEYKEADLSELGYLDAVPEVNGMREHLHSAALISFQRMTEDAAKEGVFIIPISGYRSVEQQTYLWNNQIERKGSEEAAALVSAPPGHSEHHTGYAIDIADKNHLDKILTTSFEQTPVFKWMEKNASRYEFELSFPKNNEQGISYEPWHWRYVPNSNLHNPFLGKI